MCARMRRWRRGKVGFDRGEQSDVHAQPRLEHHHYYYRRFTTRAFSIRRCPNHEVSDPPPNLQRRPASEGATERRLRQLAQAFQFLTGPSSRRVTIVVKSCNQLADVSRVDARDGSELPLHESDRYIWC